MSLPYFRMFPTDFEADTCHLTLEEDGAYNRLLRLCWTTPRCSIPADPEWIKRRMRVNNVQFEKVVLPILREFFKLSRGRYYNPRLRKEWKDVSDTRVSRQKAGSKGGSAQAFKKKGKHIKPGLSNQNQNQNHNNNPPNPPERGARRIGVPENVKMMVGLKK